MSGSEEKVEFEAVVVERESAEEVPLGEVPARAKVVRPIGQLTDESQPGVGVFESVAAPREAGSDTGVLGDDTLPEGNAEAESNSGSGNIAHSRVDVRGDGDLGGGELPEGNGETEGNSGFTGMDYARAGDSLGESRGVARLVGQVDESATVVPTSANGTSEATALSDPSSGDDYEGDKQQQSDPKRGQPVRRSGRVPKPVARLEMVRTGRSYGSRVMDIVSPMVTRVQNVISRARSPSPAPARARSNSSPARAATAISEAIAAVETAAANATLPFVAAGETAAPSSSLPSSLPLEQPKHSAPPLLDEDTRTEAPAGAWVRAQDVQALIDEYQRLKGVVERSGTTVPVMKTAKVSQASTPKRKVRFEVIESDDSNSDSSSTSSESDREASANKSIFSRLRRDYVDRTRSRKIFLRFKEIPYFDFVNFDSWFANLIKVLKLEFHGLFTAKEIEHWFTPKGAPDLWESTSETRDENTRRVFFELLHRALKVRLVSETQLRLHVQLFQAQSKSFPLTTKQVENNSLNQEFATTLYSVAFPYDSRTLRRDNMFLAIASLRSSHIGQDLVRLADLQRKWLNLTLASFQKSNQGNGGGLYAYYCSWTEFLSLDGILSNQTERSILEHFFRSLWFTPPGHKTVASQVAVQNLESNFVTFCSMNQLTVEINSFAQFLQMKDLKDLFLPSERRRQANALQAKVGNQPTGATGGGTANTGSTSNACFKCGDSNHLVKDCKWKGECGVKFSTRSGKCTRKHKRSCHSNFDEATGRYIVKARDPNASQPAKQSSAVRRAAKRSSRKTSDTSRNSRPKRSQRSRQRQRSLSRSSLSSYLESDLSATDSGSASGVHSDTESSSDEYSTRRSRRLRSARKVSSVRRAHDSRSTRSSKSSGNGRGDRR